MQIIAFAGLAESGKTTARDTILATAFRRGYNPVRESLAAPLKEAAALLGFIKGSDTDHLYRKFCQMAGELARSYDPDHFVNLLNLRLAKRLADEGTALNTEAAFHETLVGVDDVRFENEAALIRRWGGSCVFIDGSKRITNLNEEWRNHVSESMARGYTQGQLYDELFDFTVMNNGTKEGFERVIRAMFPSWAGEIAEETINE